ncbi:MAG TPA: DUF748 domain-containing protein [Bacteroidia bacterium]|nr:DUF748 domain-containing protein [Bacteroidia bacterium]
MKKLLKYISAFLLILVGIIVILLLIVSPIAKYEINKNCVQWTGRHISVGRVSLNPLTGSVFIKDLKIYEADSTTVFFDCHDIYIKVNLKKLLSSNYEIEEIKIDKPEISIVQNGNKFNFDDLIKRFASDTTKKAAPKKNTDLVYDIKNVIITNGNITYNNVPVHNIFSIHELNFKLPEISSDIAKAKVHVDFNYGTGGSFNIDLEADTKTLAYDLSLDIDKYDMSQYYAPLNAFMKISSLSGQFNTKLRMHGKFNKPEEFSLVCSLNIKDFEIKDMVKRKIFALHEFSTTIDTINVKQNLFVFRSIILDKPYIAYDILAKGSNISQAMVEHETREVVDTASGKTKRDYSNIFALIQSSLQSSAIDFLSANYHADSIAIRNGEFIFNDLTSDHRFHCTVSGINMLTDEIGPNNKEVLFHLSALLDDTGKLAMKANLTYNLKKKLFSYKILELAVPDLSPVTKYVLEKNSVKWTGRRITTGGIKLDPLNGSLSIKNIKIYEADSTNVFFDCHDVFVKVNLTKMTDNVYEVDNINIDNPEISIIQNGNYFNFDDLAKRYTPDTAQQSPQSNSPGVHYDIKNISITNGNITYNNAPIHNVFKIHELNLNVPEVSWNNPQTNVHMDFNYGTSGSFATDITANRTTSRYTISLSIDNYDLSQYYAPVNSFISISSLKGQLSTKLRMHGKFHNPSQVSGTGYVHVNNFEIQDTNKQKVFALGELALDIDTINVKHGIFYLNNVLLDKPFIRFDYLPNGNNISQMIKSHSSTSPVKDTSTGEYKPDYSNIFTMISSSIKLMAIDFVNTNYHTDSVIVRNGQFLFSDYTLNTPFHCNISELNATTDKISSTKKSLQFNISSKFNDTARIVMSANMSLDMKNMVMNYNVSNFRLSDINPYSEYYVGVPFIDGYMNYQSTDSVVNRFLVSTNIIHISGIKAGKKVETKATYNLPVRTAIALMKDEKGNIDLNLPASGNLDDPNYKIGKLVGRMLKDVVVKTAESPFRLLSKLIDRDPEDMKQFVADYVQEKLNEKQFSKLESIYKVLDKKKDLIVEIDQVTDSVQEKDELALFMAKKKYHDETSHIVNDSLLTRRKKRKELRKEDKIAATDTLFDNYLNQKLHYTGNELITIEDKCIKLIGDSLLNKQVHDMMEGRNKQIVEYLINKKSMHPERVKVVFSKDSTKIGNVAQPEFDIKYTVEEDSH